MPHSEKQRQAEQWYYAGQALFQQCRYQDALTELSRAENAFREMDAHGHPFTTPLPNGVSGLANTLALAGRSLQQLGNYAAAITSYETCLINQKFERRTAFRAFLHDVQDNLAACYECQLASLDEETMKHILEQEIKPDPSYQFPFSLPRNAIPPARLYELAPARYTRFRSFYENAKVRDTALRRQAGKDRDENRMKWATASIWLVLGLLWLIYSIVMVNALISG